MTLGIIGGSLLLCASAQAVVTAHFIESDGGVTVTFSGSLSIFTPNPVDVSPAGAFTQGLVDPISLYTAGSDGFSLSDVGVNMVSVLGFFITLNLGSGSFGFLENALFFDDSIVVGGSVANPTLLVLDGTSSTHFLRFNGPDVATLTNNAMEGQVLWIADGTSDTIVFSTQVAPVPEPSSAMLFCFGIGGALLRRKR